MADVGVNLTGAWHCDDIGTYYIREVGNTVWWLGLSCDQGRQFANVYRGNDQRQPDPRRLG